MTTVMVQYATLQPGDLVLDYASFRPTEQLLRDLNIKAVCRYIAQTTKIPGKLLTPAEISWLHSIGVGVIPNYESYATRPNGGYTLGAIDGLFAYNWATISGLPVEVPIVASDDTNVTATTLPSHLNYQIGFDDACTAWGTGPYGDNDIMQACVDAGRSDQILWYAGARSWSGGKDPIPECHMQQTVKGSVGGKYDMNVVLRPVNVWLPHEVQVPPRKDEDMDRFVTLVSTEGWPDGGYDVYTYDRADGTKRADSLEQFRAIGYPDTIPGVDPGLAPVRVMSRADLALIPNWKPLTVTVPPIVIPPITLPPFPALPTGGTFQLT